MELVKTNTGNERQPLYEDNRPEATYYIEFQDKINDDENILPYSYKILDQK